MSNEPTKIIDKRGAEIAPIAPQTQIAVNTPASMMIEAKRAGMTTDELKEMLAIQKEWEQNEARKAYHLAVAAFKDEEITITKDKKVRFGDTAFEHASLANIVSTTVPYLSKHGLSHHWVTEQTENTIKVTCTLTHQLGHSESTSMQSAPDASGKKNAIQAIASAVTYLERYTFMAITGLAAHDMVDDDGNSASEPAVVLISDKQIADLRAMIDECGTTEADFLATTTYEKIEDIPASRYAAAVNKLEQKRAMS